MQFQYEVNQAETINILDKIYIIIITLISIIMKENNQQYGVNANGNASTF